MAIRGESKQIKFDPSLVIYELTPQAREIMKTLKENIFIISNLSDTKESYEEFLDTLLNNMHYGFEHKEFRECTVTFKFHNTKTEIVKFLPYKEFIVNAILWYPQVIINPDELDDTFILSKFEISHMSSKIEKDYFDSKYMNKYRNFEGLGAILHDCSYYCRQISTRFNPFMGLSMNVNVFIDLERRIPEYGELMRFHVDESKQPAEIESDIKNAANRQVELILNDSKFNPLKAIIQPNAVKLKQLSEVQTLIGLKPDDQGRTMTRPINTRYIVEGLNNIFNLYIEAVSGRTAAIINKTLMGTAGHLLILTAIMTESVKLSKTPTDCGGTNLVPIEIKNKNVLKKINMRKYKRPGQKQFHTINFNEDESLIGETVWMRSPVTCGCDDGTVCKECYGDLWYVNKDLNSAGAFAGFITMNPVVQGLLGAKHHQGTNSNMIQFNEGFDDYFLIDSTDIIIRNDIDGSESYKLIIKVSDIETTTEEIDSIKTVLSDDSRLRNKKGLSRKDDDDSSDVDEGAFNLPYYTKEFYVAKHFGLKSRQQLQKFADIDHKELYMHTDFINRMTPTHDDELGDILIIDFDDIEMSEFIFLIELENNGVVKPMREIEKLISNKYHEGCDTYEALINKMIDLLLQAGIDVQSVHGEMIIRQLIRRTDNRLKRPDFTKVIMRNDYEILTLNTALKYSPSLSTSLNTAFLKYQLVSMCETDDKYESSDFDQIFMRTLNLEELVKHSGGRID